MSRHLSVQADVLQREEHVLLAAVPAAEGGEPLLGANARLYDRDMNIETVVALPEDLKAALDRRAPNPAERDGLAAAAYFAWPRPGEYASDLSVINAHADELNAEAEDALSHQVPL